MGACEPQAHAAICCPLSGLHRSCGATYYISDANRNFISRNIRVPRFRHIANCLLNADRSFTLFYSMRTPVLLTCLLVVGLSGCGTPGAPLPPSLGIPKPV